MPYEMTAKFRMGFSGVDASWHSGPGISGTSLRREPLLLLSNRRLKEVVTGYVEGPRIIQQRCSGETLTVHW